MFYNTNILAVFPSLSKTHKSFKPYIIFIKNIYTNLALFLYY